MLRLSRGESQDQVFVICRQHQSRESIWTEVDIRYKGNGESEPLLVLNRVAMHARSTDELLGSVKRKRLDVFIVRAGGSTVKDGSAAVIARVIAVGLGPEWIDLDLAIGVETIPSIGVDDDAGFDL